MIQTRLLPTTKVQELVAEPNGYFPLKFGTVRQNPCCNWIRKIVDSWDVKHDDRLSLDELSQGLGKLLDFDNSAIAAVRLRGMKCPR